MDVTSSVPESYVLRSKNSDVDKQVDEPPWENAG